MTTANDIITQAFKKSGLLGDGQTMSGNDMVDGLTDLNDMLAQWQVKRYLVYHLVNQVVTCTGNQTYTVGPGGQFNFAVRPDRIESAFLRLNAAAGPSTTPVDIPLTLYYAREDYDRIRLKMLGTLSQIVFYDTDFPTGLAYPWPIPQANIYALGLTFKAVLSTFASVNTVVNLPPEYIPALKFNLAVWFRQAYGKGMRPDPELKALAKNSLSAIRGSNVQVPTLMMPKAVRGTNSGYNYRSDTPGP